MSRIVFGSRNVGERLSSLLAWLLATIVVRRKGLITVKVSPHSKRWRHSGDSRDIGTRPCARRSSRHDVWEDLCSNLTRGRFPKTLFTERRPSRREGGFRFLGDLFIVESLSRPPLSVYRPLVCEGQVTHGAPWKKMNKVSARSKNSFVYLVGTHVRVKSWTPSLGSLLTFQMQRYKGLGQIKTVRFGLESVYVSLNLWSPTRIYGK